MPEFVSAVSPFSAGRRITTSCAPVSGGGLRLFGKAARGAAVLGDEIADGELLQQGPVQRVGERPLHGNDVSVRDVGGLAGGNALQRGQNTGVQPGRGRVPAKAASSLAPVASRTLPLRSARNSAAWAAVANTMLPAGSGLCGPQQPVIFHPGAAQAARMFLVASTA